MANDNNKQRQVAVVNTMSLADIVGQQNGSAWDTLCQVGGMLAKSGFLGKGVTETGGIAAAMTMAQEGLSPVEFKRRYHIIGDTPTRVTNSLLGDYISMGGTYEIQQCDCEVCAILFVRGKMKWLQTVTMKEMVEAKVVFGNNGVKDNWSKFPDSMLFARCCAKGLRRIAPDLMGGIYTKEEAQDFGEDADTPRVLTAQEVQARVAPAKTAALPAPAQQQTIEIPEVEREYVPADQKDEADEAPAARVEPEVIVVQPEEDFTVCPIAGPCFGKKFADMEIDILTFALRPETMQKFPCIKPGHIAEIKKEIERKNAEAHSQE